MPHNDAFPGMSNLVIFFKGQIHTRQIAAAKSSRKVVKCLSFYYSGSPLKDTISRPHRQQKFPTDLVSRDKTYRPFSGIRAEFVVHLSGPELLLRNLYLIRLSVQLFLLLPGILHILHPAHLLHRILQSKVRVRIHRHADVAVAHQVLQSLRVHTSLRLQAAVGVAAYVRRDVRHAWVGPMLVQAPMTPGALTAPGFS